jgi:peptidoglycan L-alanyl-D-glutamate endopeptidase CwlK
MPTCWHKRESLIRVVQGLRSWTEQDALYAMGRTAPGKIVTNVKGGYSYHNYGMAVDCVPSIHGSTSWPISPTGTRTIRHGSE